MKVAIDARVPLLRGRGWGRFATQFLRQVTRTRDAGVSFVALVPDTPAGFTLRVEIGSVVDVRVCGDRLPDEPDYLCSSFDFADPQALLGSVDLLHCLTRFVPATAVRPVVATVHDITPLVEPPFKTEVRASTVRALERLYAYDARIMAVSAATRSDLLRYSALRGDRIDVVHPGADSPCILPHARMPANRPRQGCDVLFVGGAGANKNLDRLVQAVATLREEMPVRLHFTGAPEWGYDILLARLDKPGRQVSGVIYHGLLDDADLAALYGRMDALVMPSLHEGFGLPIVEAMANRTPVCCSDIPVFREVAGDTTFYFDPRCSASMARTLKRCLADPVAAHERADLAYGRAMGYCWENAVRQTIDIYKDTV